MSANKEDNIQKRRSRSDRPVEVENASVNESYRKSSINMETTAKDKSSDNTNCASNEDCNFGPYKKQARVSPAKWKQQKLQQPEQPIEDFKNNDQIVSSSSSDEIEVDWLRIVMNLDGHDVVANLKFVRRDSIEDPPTGVEPFSRPYHERRLSLADTEEVY